jgi:hypothetical protein
MIWISTKPCITHMEGINAYINKYAYTNTFICIRASLIIDKFGSGGGGLLTANGQSTSSSWYRAQSQSYLTTDGQSASLSWCQATIRACDQFFFLLEIFLRHLRVCYFVTPSLTRGGICNLLLLLVLASAVPRDWRPYFIVPILETPPTWRVWSPYLYHPGTGWPKYTPGHWVPFPSPLTTRRAPRRVLVIKSRHGPFQNHHVLYFFKSKSHYDRQSVGQSVLVPGPHPGPATNFSFSLRFSLDSFGFVIL